MDHFNEYCIDFKIPTQTKSNQLSTYVIIPNYVTKIEMKEQIKKAYDEWKKKYVRVIGTLPKLYYIEYDDKGSTVSEAHGFGMLTAASMAMLGIDTQEFFDGMLLYSKEHPSKGNPSLMAWKQIRDRYGKMTDEKLENTYSATVGDFYIAYSLLLANKLWGNNNKSNYKKEANRIISALMDSVVNKQEWTIKLGDWVKDEDVKYGKATRTSDWMVGHMQHFYQDTGDKRWKRTINKILELTSFFQKTFSCKTGLLPDFIWKVNGQYKSVNPFFLEGKYDHRYYYNACRLPWRLAMGYHYLNDSRIKFQLDKINFWIKNFTKLDPNKVMAGYQLDGNPLSSYSDLAFIAPFAVSASIDIVNQDWLNKLWRRMTEYYDPNHDSNYYNDSIRLLSMISILSVTPAP